MSAKTGSPGRLLALDVFRGLTIGGMIVVNNQFGDHAYTALRHAGWNGWTLADLVFPFFVFIMGVALAFSLSNRSKSGQPASRLYGHTLYRAILLFALGLISYYDPAKWPEHMRIMGVLQRLAVVYLFASLITMNSGKRGLVCWTVGLLAGYWILMKYVAVPGFGAGDLSRAGNLAGYIDNIILKGHMHTEVWEPEGILSTIPSIASCLIGVLVGNVIKSEKSLAEKLTPILVAGNVLIVLAFIANNWFPINKNLWSPSFVLLTAGIGSCLLAVLIWVIDYKSFKWWTGPFFVLGRNPLFAYLISGLLMSSLTWFSVSQLGGTCDNHKTLEGCPAYQGCVWDQSRNKCITPGVNCKLFRMESICGNISDCSWNSETKKCVNPHEGKVTLKNWIAQNLFFSWAGFRNGSLFFTLAYVMLWMGITGIMYRFKIIIKL
ncbi:MAG TPA: heparan-alpha-glucosaminide N-acetyltransferase domain-containing protein [bacterium]|nr:heparan-alpha-glucosaminide N-acetyltransferase domain-containing protein [bacterium]